MPAPALLPHDMKLFNRLKAGIDAANRGVESAHAGLARASIAAQAANSAMSTFMEHCAEMYGLKAQDVVDAEGTIHLVDPAWAMEAAQQAQQEAVAAQEATAQQDLEALGQPPEAVHEEVPDVRVTRVEEEEPTILPLEVAPPMQPAPVKTRRSRAR